MIGLTPVEISIRSIIYKLQSWYRECKNVEICSIHKAIYLYKHSNVFIIQVNINIPWSKQACLKAETWLFLCESAIQLYWIYKHDSHGTVGVFIWSPAKWNVSRIDTNTVTQILGQSPLLGIGGSMVGTQSPDFEWELYDLGQDHGGTLRAAELLKFIFDH